MVPKVSHTSTWNILVFHKSKERLKYHLLLSFTSSEDLHSNQEFRKSEGHPDDIESLPHPRPQSLTTKAVKYKFPLKPFTRKPHHTSKKPFKWLHPPSYHDASLCFNLVSPPMEQRNAIFPSFHKYLLGYHHIHLQALQGRGTASWRPVQCLTQLGRNQSLSLCIIFVRPNLHQWMHWPCKAGKCHFRDEKMKQKDRQHSNMPKFTQKVCARPGNQALFEHLKVVSSPFGTAEI